MNRILRFLLGVFLPLSLFAGPINPPSGGGGGTTGIVLYAYTSVTGTSYSLIYQNTNVLVVDHGADLEPYLNTNGNYYWSGSAWTNNWGYSVYYDGSESYWIVAGETLWRLFSDTPVGTYNPTPAIEGHGHPEITWGIATNQLTDAYGRVNTDIDMAGHSILNVSVDSITFTDGTHLSVTNGNVQFSGTGTSNLYVKGNILLGTNGIGVIDAGGLPSGTTNTYTLPPTGGTFVIYEDLGTQGATNATLDLNGTVTTAVYDSVSRTLAISGTVSQTASSGATNVTLLINGQIVTGVYTEATGTIDIPSVGDYLRLDGTTNMNADLNMGGYSLTNALAVHFKRATDSYMMGIGQLAGGAYGGTMWVGRSGNEGEPHLWLYSPNWDGYGDVVNVTIPPVVRIGTSGFLTEDPTPVLRVGNYIQQYASFDGTDYSAHFRFNQGQHEAYVGRSTEGAYFSNSLSIATVNSVNDARPLKIADDEVQDQYTWVSPSVFGVHGTNGEVVAISGIVNDGSNALVRLDSSSVEHLLFDSGTIPQSAGVLVTDGAGNLSVRTISDVWITSVATNDDGTFSGITSNLYTVLDPLP